MVSDAFAQQNYYGCPWLGTQYVCREPVQYNEYLVSVVLWILLVWCFSTREPVATVLSTHLVLESSEISSAHSTPFSCQHVVKFCICHCQTIFYDDVLKWKHFLRYWLFVRGIHRSPLNSPHKGQWRRALMFSLICAWINGWVNNREAPTAPIMASL